MRHFSSSQKKATPSPDGINIYSLGQPSGIKMSQLETVSPSTVFELRDQSFREKYVKDLCSNVLNLGTDTVTICSTDSGVLNFVYRVDCSNVRFYIKQALPEAKIGDIIARELIEFPEKRVLSEKHTLEALAAHASSEIVLPKLLHFDSRLNIIVLSDVGGNGATLLEEEQIQGHFDEENAKKLGSFLGRVHERTFGNHLHIRGSEKDDQRNWLALLALRTKNIRSEKFESDVNAALQDLYEEGQTNATQCLMHMDCCPKNILCRADGRIGIIDLEFAQGIGDPAYDVGFLLGHYYLHALLYDLPFQSFQAMHFLLSAYDQQQRASNGANFRDRVYRYAASTLLYRSVGASRAKFQNDEFLTKIIKKASAILKGQSSFF